MNAGERAFWIFTAGLFLALLVALSGCSETDAACALFGHYRPTADAPDTEFGRQVAAQDSAMTAYCRPSLF